MVSTKQLGPLGQVSRSVGDIEASTRWYRDTLGLEHLYTFGKLSFFDLNGTRLFLEESPRPSAESVLYFRVTDIRERCAELEARGIQFTSAPHCIHQHDDGMEEWMAFFIDLEGRPLALMEQRRPATASVR